jgi:FKBP-type peptidyl-prolyl cis-trans isomerase FkpA
MNKQRTIIFSLLIVIIATINSSCNSDGFSKTDTGLKYKLYSKGGGTKPKTGDLLSMDMYIKTDNDSILLDSKKKNVPVASVLFPPSFKGSMEEGFAMLAEGDSGVFIVSADSIFLKTFQKPLPDFVKKGSNLTIHVTMLKITPKEEYEDAKRMKEQIYMQKMAERKGSELDLLWQYIKEKHITVKPTSSGLYFINIRTGTGPKPTQGKLVKVKYVGKFLDGSIFDESDNAKPYAFHLQQREAIQGFDEGIAMMQEGGKATLIMPSAIAYGENGDGKSVLPYSSLVFDVELIEVGK